MISYLRDWFQRQFSDPQVVALTLLLIAATALTLLMSRMMVPVLASIVVAYLLEGPTQKLRNLGVPRLGAVFGLFIGFLCFYLLVLFGLLPLLSGQVVQLLQELPAFIAHGQELLLQLPEKYPSIFSVEQVVEINRSLRGEAGRLGQQALTLSLAFLPGLITLVVYLIMMPLLVFFLLKDKVSILAWGTAFLPTHRALAGGVWREVDQQIGNYVRGKFWEILIVGSVSYLTFLILGLNFAVLLSALVGLSVLIPFIGATLVTIPIMLIGYAQWGWGNELLTLAIAYGIIQLLDANVLVPILFSEVVNLHPVAIIVAILFFGSIWGFWGIFFAIPLATVVKAVLTAWPRRAGPVEPPTVHQVG